MDKSVTRAVIDVGTNSIKLLVASIQGIDVVPLIEKSEQTRLGQGFFETHQLNPEAIQRTAQAVSDFATLARQVGAEEIRVIATSAARDAENQEELLSAINEAAGLTVQVISGAQEADWVFQGVRTDRPLASHPLLVMDIGGGSTEFILGAGERPIFRESYRLGSVRLLEALTPADPPTEQNQLECERTIRQVLAEQVSPALNPLLQKFDRQKLLLVSTGGTATILARMSRQLRTFDRQAIDGAILDLEYLRQQTGVLWRLPLAARQQLPGLPASRADVILTGAMILREVVETFGFREARVSTRGLRFAAALSDRRIVPNSVAGSA